MKLREILLTLLCSTALSVPGSTVTADEKPDILIVTVDDMSCDSIGVYGCQLADTTPAIDRFSETALRFRHAHVHVGNCMPGRNIMWSGMFSHRNGVEGFRQNRNPDYPVLCDLAKDAGYFTAIRGKVSHSTPYIPYAWDADVTVAPDGRKYHIKDPESYGHSLRDAIRLATEADRPLCAMINISDPHKPFFNELRRDGKRQKDTHRPSETFPADKVPVPGFLHDSPEVRTELADYYNSVRRADDCFAAVMNALQESGRADRTVVVFLSDHGMPLPFAKTQLYYHSTHTPLMVRWPGITRPDHEDRRHMIGAVDLLPTLLEIMQHPHPRPERLQGRSFAAVLRGQEDVTRDHVILQYNENSARDRRPIRGIQTRRFLYLFNPWSDGERRFTTATTGTHTYRDMTARAPADPAIAARLKLFDHRVIEELYDIQADENCRFNLIEDPGFRTEVEDLRSRLAARLSELGDPAAAAAAAPGNTELREAYMAKEDRLTAELKKNRRRPARNRRNPARRSPPAD